MWRGWPVCWQDCRRRCQVRPTDSVPLSGRRGARFSDLGDVEVWAGGVEHMTPRPWVLSKASKLLDVTWNCMTPAWVEVHQPRLDALYGTDGMGQTAENLWTCTTSAGRIKMPLLAEVNRRLLPPSGRTIGRGNCGCRHSKAGPTSLRPRRIHQAPNVHGGAGQGLGYLKGRRR